MSEETARRMLAMYEAGANVSEIGAAHGVTKQWVSAILNRLPEWPTVRRDVARRRVYFRALSRLAARLRSRMGRECRDCGTWIGDMHPRAVRCVKCRVVEHRAGVQRARVRYLAAGRCSCGKETDGYVRCAGCRAYRRAYYRRKGQ